MPFVSQVVYLSIYPCGVMVPRADTVQMVHVPLKINQNNIQHSATELSDEQPFFISLLSVKRCFLILKEERNRCQEVNGFY